MRDGIARSPPSPPGYLWVTPPTPYPRYSCSFVSNLLTHLLDAPPARLSASNPSELVFHATVVNQNVAKFITARGVLRLGPSVFTLHSSMAVAQKRAAALEEDDAALNSQRPQVTVSLNNVLSGRAITGRAARASRPLLLAPLAVDHSFEQKIPPYPISTATAADPPPCPVVVTGTPPDICDTTE